MDGFYRAGHILYCLFYIPFFPVDSSPIDIPLVISSSAAVITVALIICFAGYCICIGKRYSILYM